MTAADPFEQRLARLREVADEQYQAFIAILDHEAEPSRQCEHHSDHVAVLNRERSIKQRELIYECRTCIEERRAVLFAKLQTESGVPLSVQHATLQNFEVNRPGVDPQFDSPADFLSIAQSFTRREMHALILSGSVGIGKTHLTAAIARQRLTAGHSVRMIRTDVLWNLVHANYNKGSSSTRTQILRPFCECALLILDDIAIKALPADGEQILYDIYDYRNEHKKQSLFTTNQPYVRLAEWFGERVWDRLMRNGKEPTFIYGQWQSKR